MNYHLCSTGEQGQIKPDCCAEVPPPVLQQPLACKQARPRCMSMRRGPALPPPSDVVTTTSSALSMFTSTI